MTFLEKGYGSPFEALSFLFPPKGEINCKVASWRVWMKEHLLIEAAAGGAAITPQPKFLYGYAGGKKRGEE